MSDTLTVVVIVFILVSSANLTTYMLDEKGVSLARGAWRLAIVWLATITVIAAIIVDR